VNPILHFPGSSVLSPFRREQLLKRFAALGLPISDITGQYEHYVWLEAPLGDAGRHQLEQLLDYGTPVEDQSASRNPLVLRVFPRLGTVSPWASKATDIAHNCGLSAVRRIERGVRYTLVPERGLLGPSRYTKPSLPRPRAFCMIA